MTRSLRADYALVPHWFLRQAVQIYELTTEDLAVFVALCGHSDRHGVAWCAQRRLALEAGVVRSTVQNSLARLVELEILIVHESGQSHRATRFRIPDRCPLPLKVIPLPTRRARWQGDAWVGVDEDAL